VDHRLRAVRCDAHASQRIAKGCRQARSRYYREGGADDTENEGDDEETPARARDHGPPPLSAPSPAATDSSARPRTAGPHASRRPDVEARRRTRGISVARFRRATRRAHRMGTRWRVRARLRVRARGPAHDAVRARGGTARSGHHRTQALLPVGTGTNGDGRRARQVPVWRRRDRRRQRAEQQRRNMDPDARSVVGTVDDLLLSSAAIARTATMSTRPWIIAAVLACAASAGCYRTVYR